MLNMIEAVTRETYRNLKKLKVYKLRISK